MGAQGPVPLLALGLRQALQRKEVQDVVKKKVVVFVCGGNTHRSPMAKVILEQELMLKGLEKRFRVDSAARRRPDGTKAAPEAREAIQEIYGKDLLADHVPKALSDEMVKSADRIIVMEEHMKSGLPPGKKVEVLGIDDPAGQGIDGCKECAEHIKRRLMEIWDTIVEEVPTSHPRVASAVSGAAVDWVCSEVLKIAKSVNYGRGPHSQTVTRYLWEMYEEMGALGLLQRTADKDKLVEVVGLSHDIGVVQGEPHNLYGFKKVKDELWNDVLPSDRKSVLAIVMYAIYYHRDKVHDGNLSRVDNVPFGDTRTVCELTGLIRVADGLDYGPPRGTLDLLEKVEMVRTASGVECRVTPRQGKEIGLVRGTLARSWEKREVFEARFGKLSFWLPGSGPAVSWHRWGTENRPH